MRFFFFLGGSFFWEQNEQTKKEENLKDEMCLSCNTHLKKANNGEHLETKEQCSVTGG